MKRYLLILSIAFGLSLPTYLAAQDNKGNVAVEVVETTTPELYVSNNRLYIKNAPIGQQVEVFTILGNKVKEFKIDSKEVDFNLNLPKGIYIFKVKDTVRKIVLK